MSESKCRILTSKLAITFRRSRYSSLVPIITCLFIFLTSAALDMNLPKLSFLASAALMQQAKMNYVNDSAPLHIASAMNAPVTAYFCSTIPSFGFGPLSTNSKIIEIKEKESIFNSASKPGNSSLHFSFLQILSN